MKKLLSILILSITPALSLCFIDCNTSKCSSLDYYMKKCNKCKSIGKKCSESFCKTHPRLCQHNTPLHPLSIGTGDIIDDRLHDVCIVPLFTEFKFEEKENSALTLDNLNTLTIIFFEQTKGSTPDITKQRNIGTVRNILANYFAILYPELRTQDPTKSIEQVSLMIRMKFGKTLEQASNLDYHNMIETIRSELYARKGIPITKVFEQYQNKNYPITISNIGCISEKTFKPIR